MAPSAMDERLVFFDLETGGLNPKRHPIIQLAAIAVNSALQPLEAFEAKICFNVGEANRYSLRKNHYSPGKWAQLAAAPKSVAQEFADFLRRHATLPSVAANGSTYRVAQLVAHNSAFDGPFLQTWYEKQGIYLPARRQVLCTMQRAIWFFSERSDETGPRDFKLPTLCQFFGVSFQAADAHDALGDVSATLCLYRAIQERERPVRTTALAFEKSHSTFLKSDKEAFGA
jgi:DNA polymerase III epsilon subunit-like protein